MAARAGSLARPLYRPMRARNPAESRGQTQLELLFDLAFSAASGFAAVRLAELLGTGAVGTAVLGFAMVFFAIWWAWLNFAWFCSAYDTDDGLTWMVTTLLILGAATLAAGVPGAVAERDFVVITVGYAVMRLPLAAQWVRAAVGDPARRATCLRFALGMVLLQLAWFGRLALPERWMLAAFLVLALCEVAVPPWARRGGSLPTNPGHLAGRYGRFTLTVAAQVIVATVYALRLGLESPGNGPLLVVAVTTATAAVALLWLYHAVPHATVAAGGGARIWEYGHYLLVGAMGAVGGAARLLAESTAAPGTQRWAALPLAVAVAVVLLSLWLFGVLPGQDRPGLAHPTCAVLVVLSALLIPSALWTAGVVVLLLLATAAVEGLSTSGRF
ncbi:low temperature requirement protein A [Actinopolyspora mortivallis]|uniref:low temperature requirement protein A n=1 Tax=Actinopolyspora mortivallis TaxID=33906 RepID=UPI0003A6943A|nr:low temperature requirement protein A [Actinopolyspora mortivallis]